MMASPPFTTGFTVAQLAQLEASIALGVGAVDHNGKRTTFQSLQQMMVLRDRMKSEIAQAAAVATAITSSMPVVAPCMTRRTIFVRG